MIPATLLDTLAVRRVHLVRQNDTLRWKAPKGAVTDNIRSDLKAHKADLLALPESLWRLISGAVTTDSVHPASPDAALVADASDAATPYLPLLEPYAQLIQDATQGALPLLSLPIQLEPGRKVVEPVRFVLTTVAEVRSLLKPRRPAEFISRSVRRQLLWRRLTDLETIEEWRQRWQGGQADVETQKRC